MYNRLQHLFNLIAILQFLKEFLTGNIAFKMWILAKSFAFNIFLDFWICLIYLLLSMTDISFTMHFCFWKILSSSIKHENMQLFGKDINTIYLACKLAIYLKTINIHWMKLVFWTRFLRSLSHIMKSFSVNDKTFSLAV